MKMIRIVFIYCCLMITEVLAYSQTKTTDSLLNYINKTESENEKLNAIFKLKDQNLNPDTLLPYVSIYYLKI